MITAKKDTLFIKDFTPSKVLLDKSNSPTPVKKMKKLKKKDFSRESSNEKPAQVITVTASKKKVAL